jgi:cyclopropane fatty-acyl-phospholipid synthase-like methyltransferase
VKQFQVSTDYPVALDSIDHTHPGGTMHDNSRNPRFNEKLFALLSKRPLWVLDLGCAGGGFVKDMLDAGQVAIGLEGSDYSLLRKRAEWATIPDNLFTCDITRPFAVWAEQPGIETPDLTYQPAAFDVVTAWEVMEHLPEERLPTLCNNIKNLLAYDGEWIMSVSTQHGPHHVTVRPREWWLEMFKREGLEHHESLVSYFGNDWVRGPLQNAPCSFHLILKRSF